MMARDALSELQTTTDTMYGMPMIHTETLSGILTNQMEKLRLITTSTFPVQMLLNV